MYAYLTNSGYARDYEIRKNIMNNRNVMTFLRRQIATYAVLCKGNENGLDIALETARRVMAQYDVQPNMVIMDPATQLYIRMIPRENKQMYLGGNTAVEQYNSFNGGKGITTYRDLQVYTQNHFDVGEQTENVNMLERNTQVGEYYVMSPPEYLGSEKLPSSYMNLTIFDENQDRLVMITFEDAVRHACPWKLALEAAIVDPFKVKGQDWPLIQDSYNMLSTDAQKNLAITEAKIITASIADAGDNMATTFKDFEYNKKDHWEAAIALVKLGVWVPLNIVVARPFIEHRMLSMIVTVAGRDTGMTVYGQSDFQIASNVNVKMIEGHYTFHSKAIITNPKNIMVLEDVQCAGYVGGCSTKWFGDAGETAFASLSEDDQVDAIKTQLKTRVDDTDNDSDPSMVASMLAFAVPYDNTGAYIKHQMFAFGNAPLPWEPVPNSDRSFPGGNSFLKAYGQLFDLNYLSMGIDPTTVSAGTYIRNGTYNNSVCILGPSRVYSPFNVKGQLDLVPGQGHFGPDAVSGDARWRRGEAINAKQSREEQIDPATIVYTKK